MLSHRFLFGYAMGLRVENPVPIFPVSTPPPSRRHTPPYDHPGSPAPFPWHPIKTQWAFQWVRGNISGNPWRRRSPQSRVVAHVRLGPYDAVARCGHPCGTPSPAHLFLCSPVLTAGWGAPVHCPDVSPRPFPFTFRNYLDTPLEAATIKYAEG